MTDLNRSFAWTDEQRHFLDTLDSAMKHEGEEEPMKLNGLETTKDVEEAMDPVIGVIPRPGNVVVVFIPMRGGGWAAVKHPGFTCFGNTPEEAFTALNQKHPFNEEG